MCTLSAIVKPVGSTGSASWRLRVGFNRDEQRGRAEGIAPAVQLAGCRRAVWPTDPQGGGTWIAVNDGGLVAAMLNFNAARRTGPSTGRRSRGQIIPMLMASASLGEALAMTRTLDFAEYGTFRLVLLWAGGGDASATGTDMTGTDMTEADAIGTGPLGTGPIGADLRWDGLAPAWAGPTPIVRPQMRTSSSLGDDVVEGVRRELFESMSAGEAPAWQDRFHDAVWPDRTHLSVRMSRPDARTVSRTVVEVGDDVAVMRYEPLRETPGQGTGGAGAAVEIRLAIGAGGRSAADGESLAEAAGPVFQAAGGL